MCMHTAGPGLATGPPHRMSLARAEPRFLELTRRRSTDFFRGSFRRVVNLEHLQGAYGELRRRVARSESPDVAGQSAQVCAAA